MLVQRKQFPRKSAFAACLAGACVFVGTVYADDSDMTNTAKIAQLIPNKLNKNYQLPFAYNHNQDLGLANNMIQGQFQLNPVIPFAIDNQTSIILRPMLTSNFNNQDSTVSNQPVPLQLETFFAWDPGLWVYGAGPYVQAPARNMNNGSKQTGVGISASAYYKPTHWVVGFIGYNSWGIGGDTSSGTANQFQMTPSVSYTTNNAWTYTFQSKVNYNYNSSGATNQMTLSGGKTIKLLGEPVMFQIGPTYMATHTPTSAKGWGGFLGLTWVIPK